MAKVTQSQPQAVYSALAHGMIGTWVYAMRTNEYTTGSLLSLEMQIQNKLIPAITGRHPLGEVERRLLELPLRHGGLGIVNPLNMKSEYMHSKTVSTPLVNLIIQQQVELGNLSQQQCMLKEMIHKQKRKFESACGSDF